MAASLYAADALYLSAGTAPVRGREPIRRVFAEFFDGIRADGATLAIDFRIVRRDVSPALVADVSYYRLAVVREGRAGAPSFGRFVTVLRRDDAGTLRFEVDSYTAADAAEWDASAPTPRR
jgi:ketosteroid isomerase-like protein